MHKYYLIKDKIKKKVDGRNIGILFKDSKVIKRRACSNHVIIKYGEEKEEEGTEVSVSVSFTIESK